MDACGQSYKKSCPIPATGRLAGAGHVDRVTGFVWLATVVFLAMQRL